MSTTTTGQKWLRACSLIVADQQGNGLELAGGDLNAVLRIVFRVQDQNINGSPHELHARIYNLSPNTIQTIKQYASKNPPTLTGITFPTSARVLLRAGYSGALGTLFVGQIYQMRVGKEANVDSYIDIFAADGDDAHRWAKLRTSLAAGYTPQEVWEQSANSMTAWGVDKGQPPDGLSTAPSPRGKVLFGQTRWIMNDLGDSNNFTWNIQDGQFVCVPRYAAKRGEAIVINSFTGQIGVPEQTEQGVVVTCLLNPALRWGARVKLNDTEIAQFTQKLPGSTDTPGQRMVPPTQSIGQAPGVVIPLTNVDGDYVVVQATHSGDTRGNEWYSKLICLSIDPSSSPPAALGVELPPPLRQG